ncbi:MAG: DNA polymerase IV, partial [Halobacteriovoraceae bacterium]|nr:DNA polymerase IV [Halobacteriovoraceae bacterium]
SLVEPLSLDEAFLDVTDSKLCKGSATLMAKEIRAKIFERTGLTASAGVAPNKFLAKVASDWKKPNGLFVIKPEEAHSFAQCLKLEKVPGIGRVSIEKYHQKGLFHLSDINKYPHQWLENHFGKFARNLRRLSRGIDERRVGGKSFRKSLGCEETYGKDLPDFTHIQERIPFLVEELFERVERYFVKDPEGPKPFKIFVKAKTFDFNLHTHECPLRIIPLSIEGKEDLTTYKDLIHQSFEEMFQLLYNRIEEVPVRLLGIGFRMSPSPKFELEKLGQLRLL